MDNKPIYSTIDEEVDTYAGQAISLSSSWLMTAFYDKPTQTLSITTAEGREYTLTGVPPDIFLEFISAGSPGNYFNQNLKGQY